MELTGDELEAAIKTLLGIGARTFDPVIVYQHEVIGLNTNYYVMSNTEGLMGVCMWAQTTTAESASYQAQEVLNQLAWQALDVSNGTCIADYAVADIAIACG